MTRWRGVCLAVGSVLVGLAMGFLPLEAKAGEIYKLTVKDNQRREPLKVKPGDRVLVLLDFQPGTGFSWRLAPGSTKLLQPDPDKPKSGEKVDAQGNPLKPGQPPGRPGQVEHRLFFLLVPKVPGAGNPKGELKFILTRPRSDQAAKTFTVPIAVEQPG